MSGGKLDDFKVEFGLIDGKLYLADVVDCDSWRVMWQDMKLSKQVFRDDAEALRQTAVVYTVAASLTERFLYMDLGDCCGENPMKKEAS